MMKRAFCYLFTLMICAGVFAQQEKEVLMKIGDKPVYAHEFKRVYKKNLDLVKDESQKTVDGYMDLFIDYQLKIAEAYDQGLHKKPNYVTEFGKYEEQLSRNYLYDTKVSVDLAREAYERGLEEVEVSHILIMANLKASPEDTLKAYTKLQEIRKKAIDGEDFTELAKKYSEEPGAEERGGYLGYFSVFAMVYPFEDMAYKTPVGEISKIVRSQFGYHILKVTDRRQRATDRTVSHIFISDKQDDSRTFKPSERIQDIYKLIQQGEDFEALAKQYSDDKNTGVNGGRLPRFSRGQLRSKIFENFVYDLKKPGAISKPFQSEFGWHIIRMEEIHERQTWEEMRFQLEKKVKDGNRSKVFTSQINKKIKERYGFEMKEPVNPYFTEYLPDEVLERKFKYDSMPKVKNAVAFTIGDQDATFDEFAKYIDSRQARMTYYKDKATLVNDHFEQWESQVVNEYAKKRLEMDDESYATTISEYRNGLLIFDLMNANIWMKAKVDSVGLESYYQTVKDQYNWKQRVEGVVVSATSEEFAKKAEALLKQGKTEEEIKEALNEGKKVVNVIVSSGKFEPSDSKLPKDLPFQKGISDIYNIEDSFVVVRVDDVIQPAQKTLEEVRGKVLTSYQELIEQQWMESLRDKYKVKINKKVLKKIKKELES